MIEPTVGRVVWYHPAESEVGEHGLVPSDQPLAAVVAYVHSDTIINLMIIEANGVTHARTEVTLIQGDDKAPEGAFAEWMPYQKGQAAKTEQLEKKASDS